MCQPSRQAGFERKIANLSQSEKKITSAAKMMLRMGQAMGLRSGEG
jgi:hypothetical protein